MAPTTNDIAETRRRMAAGELYHAFVPELVEERQRCSKACDEYNRATDLSRRERVRMWRR
jgi:predicted RNA polymerase sigma factor